MDSRGCGFGFAVMAILFVMLFMSGMILASVGIAPIVNGNGLAWDSTAYVNHDANRTQRYIAQQQQQTVRNGQDNETARTFIIVAGIAGGIVAVVWLVEGTRRRRIQADTMVRLYAAQAYPNAQIEQRNGVRVLVDYERREIVPYGVIAQEAQAVDGVWRQV